MWNKYVLEIKDLNLRMRPNFDTIVIDFSMAFFLFSKFVCIDFSLKYCRAYLDKVAVVITGHFIGPILTG